MFLEQHTVFWLLIFQDLHFIHNHPKTFQHPIACRSINGWHSKLLFLLSLSLYAKVCFEKWISFYFSPKAKQVFPKCQDRLECIFYNPSPCPFFLIIPPLSSGMQNHSSCLIALHKPPYPPPPSPPPHQDFWPDCSLSSRNVLASECRMRSVHHCPVVPWRNVCQVLQSLPSQCFDVKGITHCPIDGCHLAPDPKLLKVCLNIV
jgi:hypothetical protein